MGEKERPQNEDTEGNMPFKRISPEGTDEENAEGNMPLKRISPEGTDEENAEGEGLRYSVSADEPEDDTEGQRRH